MRSIERKIVIYQGSGGLIHLLGGLVYCIHWCILHSHELLIDIKNHDLFLHNFTDFFYIKDNRLKWSEDYNLIPSNITHLQRKISFEYISKNNVVFNNGFWLNDGKNRINIGISLDNIPKSEIVKMYCGNGCNRMLHITQYIGVKESIINIIKNKNNMNLIQYTGIHFRNTDRPNDISKYINIIKNKLSNLAKDNIYYLATDDSTAIEKICNAINNINIIQYTYPIDCDGKPIHIYSPNKYEIIINVLIDIYYLLNATNFIDSPESLVSRLITYMRKSNTTIF